jgi:hypothetical protein
MPTPWDQMLSLFGGNIQAMRDSIAAGQTDVDPSILAQINAALGGTTAYSGAAGAGIGLAQTGTTAAPAPASPPNSPSPPVGGGATTPTAGMTSGARATLTAMLQPFGLQSLVGPAYDLQVSGVTDPTAMVLALENTQEFRARFPGMRDPTTQQMIMTPGEYVAYEKSVRQLFADSGVPQPDQAQIGSYVQQRRSVNELTTDVKAYTELQQNPYMADQFYAITGTHPGAEGMFALLTGQAPGLEDAYNKSVASGVDAATYASRLAQTTSGANFTTDSIMSALQTDPTSMFTAGAPALNNMDKTVALQRAVAANAAEYKGGGAFNVSTQKLTTTF